MNNKPKDDVELERLVNNILDLRATKNSGAVQNDADGKGIIREIDLYDQIMVDCKFTKHNKKSVSFTKKDMVKTKISAQRNGRMPIMATYQLDDTDIYVHISMNDFRRIYENHILYCKGEK